MQMETPLGARLTRKQMKQINGGNGGCCAMAYSEGFINYTECGYTMAEAKQRATELALAMDPGSSDSYSGGMWCCASCNSNY